VKWQTGPVRPKKEARNQPRSRTFRPMRRPKKTPSFWDKRNCVWRYSQNTADAVIFTLVCSTNMFVRVDEEDLVCEVLCRFILNLPSNEFESHVRFMFHMQDANRKFQDRVGRDVTIKIVRCVKYTIDQHENRSHSYFVDSRPILHQRL